MRVAATAFVPQVEIAVVVVNLTTTSVLSHHNVGDSLGLCTELHMLGP